MTIVVAYIPSPEGQAALDYAVSKAKGESVSLAVVGSMKGGAQVDRKEAEKFDEMLDRVGAQLALEGIDYTMHRVWRGNEPSEDIIAVADEVGAEAIVIGLRRRTPVGKLIMGSTAQRVLLDANCPVISVKAAPVSS